MLTTKRGNITNKFFGAAGRKQNTPRSPIYGRGNVGLD